ncbi:SixA phosphatase family protein [Chondrinema litorale]|uniref:SixA phosphatase family protein n=1 Tax=Chondrinema litorale TaxID=2994555 RepID=UPI002542BAA1|nr:histidine phosphatase family protein [Chondrinema litorale]UZR94490.1 histidine phosphatase family protein [Chondrinema litorale]
MKTLYLVRHAKSSWKDDSLDDFERPLNKRGQRDAPFMGDKLKEQKIIPDLVISSPAKRAKSTAKIIAKKIGYDPDDIKWKKKIYDAFTEDLLKIIRDQKKDIDSLMLVGHNPELTSLSNYLTDFRIYNIPTTGISCIRFYCDTWEEVQPKAGEQVFFDYPKRYFKTK